MGSENRVTALSAEEDQVLPGEATGHSGEANDIIQEGK
jgi:lysine-specific demethylase 3